MKENLIVHWADPPGTLPTPWNAGFIQIGRIMEDFTKSEGQQRQRRVMPDIGRFRSKAYSSVPGGSVMAIFLQCQGRLSALYFSRPFSRRYLSAPGCLGIIILRAVFSRVQNSPEGWAAVSSLLCSRTALTILYPTFSGSPELAMR